MSVVGAEEALIPPEGKQLPQCEHFKKVDAEGAYPLWLPNAEALRMSEDADRTVREGDGGGGVSRRGSRHESDGRGSKVTLTSSESVKPDADDSFLRGRHVVGGKRVGKEGGGGEPVAEVRGGGGLMGKPADATPTRQSGSGEGGWGGATETVQAAPANLGPRAPQTTQSPEAATGALPGANLNVGGIGGGGGGGTWTLEDSVSERLLDAFNLSEGKAKTAQLTGLLMKLGLSQAALDKTWERASFEDFKRKVERERELTTKAQVLVQAGLMRAVAECVPNGSVERPLEGLKDMDQEQLRKMCIDAVAPAVLNALLQVQEDLQEQSGKLSTVVDQGVDGNGKFGFDDANQEDVKTAVFGELEDFHKGIADKIGLPNARLLEGMEAEHCRRSDSKIEFTPGNYNTRTTASVEWAVVTEESKGDAASVSPRRVRHVRQVLKDEIAVKAGLREEEVIALMLYTGPMFYKYNAVLRGFPESVVESLDGNTYTTTIYCIVSGIIKLSKVMKLPEDRKVYRGLRGLQLPDAFTTADQYGVCGGVEFAMLSTTLEKSVALQYANDAVPLIFEIQVGGVDRGASLNFLSQYPEEDEILFPPRSYLEVMNRTPRREIGPDNKPINILELKVNANLTSSTIEDIEGRRRQLFLSSAKNSVMEISSWLRDELSSQRVSEILSRRAFDKQNKMHVAVSDSIVKEADEWLKGYTSKNGEWFNKERQYASALREMTVMETMAIGKFESWIEGTSGLTAEQLAKESMEQLNRRARAEKRRQLVEACKEEGAVGGESETVRKLALDLCLGRGIVIQGVDDQNGMLLEPGVVSCGVEGDVVSLKLLLLAGCNVNGKAKDGSTALHAASVMGHLEYVRELVNGGADAFERNKTGETCLHLACQMGHSEVVRFLVEEYGKDLCMAETTSGATCALLACRNGRMEALRCIGKAGGRDLLMKVAKNGASCAASAAGQGRLEVLEYLVEECGPEILELVTDQGMSCAYLASQNGHLECVRFLAVKGGKELLKKVTKHGVSCAHRACEQGHLAVLEFLEQQCGREILKLKKTGSTAGRLTSCFELAEANNHKEVLEYISKKLEHE